MKLKVTTTDKHNSEKELWQEAEALRSRMSIGEHFTPEYITDLVAEFSRSLLAKRILDPASGSGRLLHSVHQALGGMVEAIGVEINSEVFSLAQSKRPGIRFINSDFFSLHTDALNTFDLIVCNPPFGPRLRQEVFRL